MFQVVVPSRLLPQLPLFLMTAITTHLVMSFAQKRNGNTQHVPARQRASRSVTMTRHSAIMLGSPAIPAKKHTSLARRSLMRSVSTTCRGTCGNGLRTAITTATRTPQSMGEPGCHRIEMKCGSSAAVPGAAFRTASARPAASGASPTSGSSTTGFVSRGRLLLESLPLGVHGRGAGAATNLQPPSRA
jgi:hypothetical protein